MAGPIVKEDGNVKLYTNCLLLASLVLCRYWVNSDTKPKEDSFNMWNMWNIVDSWSKPSFNQAFESPDHCRPTRLSVDSQQWSLFQLAEYTLLRFFSIKKFFRFYPLIKNSSKVRFLFLHTHVLFSQVPLFVRWNSSVQSSGRSPPHRACQRRQEEFRPPHFCQGFSSFSSKLPPLPLDRRVCPLARRNFWEPWRCPLGPRLLFGWPLFILSPLLIGPQRSFAISLWFQYNSSILDFYLFLLKIL